MKLESFNQFLKGTGADTKFRDGTLVNDGGTIYIISDGKKRGFGSLDALTSKGYKTVNSIQARLENYEEGERID